MLLQCAVVVAVAAAADVVVVVAAAAAVVDDDDDSDLGAQGDFEANSVVLQLWEKRLLHRRLGEEGLARPLYCL